MSTPGTPDHGVAAAVDQRLSAGMRVELRRVHASVQAFYLIDALLLTGYGVAGTVPLQLGWIYGLVGCGLSGLGLVWFWGRGGREADLDPSTLMQTLVAVSVMLATLGVAPQVGGMMLMSAMAVLVLSAVRLKGKHLLALCLVIPVVSVWMLAVADEGVSVAAVLPTANLAERLLTVVWLAWLLVKASAHNLAGTRLRKSVSEANHRLAQALQDLEKTASTDELTVLPNRRAILAHLNLALVAGGHQAGSFIGVALMDLDDFKTVNDRHGHDIGDQVLRAFGQLASCSVRPSDRVGRYGGEEFLLVMPQMPDATAAAEAAERVRANVQAHDWSAVAPGLAVTVSAGVALLQPGEDAASAIRRADAALYGAKRGGRNRVEHAFTGRMPPTISPLEP